MFDLPRIKIEIENMRYQIVHAFSTHNDEIEKAVDEEIRKVIENYPFSEVVSKLASEVLEKSIKHSLEEFLLYGEGSKVLKESVDKLLADKLKRMK